jgi:hypothetical protein
LGDGGYGFSFVFSVQLDELSTLRLLARHITSHCGNVGANEHGLEFRLAIRPRVGNRGQEAERKNSVVQIDASNRSFEHWCFGFGICL